MPLPILLAGRAWAALRTARLILREWQSLPVERRAELRGSVQRLGPLAVELTGSLAAERRGRPSRRPLREVVDELSLAIGDLRRAAPDLAAHKPRTRRGRLAVKAAGGLAARTVKPRVGSDAPPDHETPGDENELEDAAAEFAALAYQEAAAADAPVAQTKGSTMRFRKRRRPDVPSGATLADYGKAVVRARVSGESVTDPRFGWEFIRPVCEALSGGGAAAAAVIAALEREAHGAPDRDAATVGAYAVIAECQPDNEDPVFLKLLDTTLEHMRARGFSSGHLTRYEADRWIAVHGDLRSSFDGIFEVAVPDSSEVPAPTLPELGGARLLALTEPLPRGNAFFGEHRRDGTFAVYSERVYSSEDPTRGRYEETRLGSFERYEDLLRALGDMFGTPPFWSDPDLEPYFPSRRAR